MRPNHEHPMSFGREPQRSPPKKPGKAAAGDMGGAYGHG